MKKRRIPAFLLCFALMAPLLTGCGSSLEDVAELPAMQELMAEADARRESILSSETAIIKDSTAVPGETYTGRAWYISNSGSDKNSGKSPEKALATLRGLERKNVKPGDAVFFERGGIWRGERILWLENITYSAYGEGEKPKLYASAENGGGAEKWSLFYEGEKGEKIWEFYQETAECGGIVLGGETMAEREYAFWKDGSWLKLDFLHPGSPSDTVFSVEEHLKDMMFFHCTEFGEGWNPAENAHIMWDEASQQDIYPMGKLYFRCDAGNPGELYSDIEFLHPYAFVDGMPGGTVVDNLNISYCGSDLNSGGTDEGPNQSGVIQNCEIGWSGGLMDSYYIDPAYPNDLHVFPSNGGLCIFGSDYTVRNNYIHHAYYSGFNAEARDESVDVENLVISGNLIEKNRCGISVRHWGFHDRIFRNVTVEDNFVFACGEEEFTYYLPYQEQATGFYFEGDLCPSENLVVRNNTFALAAGAIVTTDKYLEEYRHVFSGNTYAQYPGGSGICMTMSETKFPLNGKNLLKYFGDESPNIIELK